MATKAEVLASIADGSILNNVMPPLAERIAIRKAHLAEQQKEFQSWLDANPNSDLAKESDRGYGNRQYHGD